MTGGTAPPVAAGRRGATPLAVLRAFLALGVAGFGGPAAHLGLMEEALVRRRAWLSRDEFLALVGTVQLLPGPTSTELALVIGRRLLGWRGFWLAALGFVLPAVVLTWGLAAVWLDLRTAWLDARLRAGLAPAVTALLLVTAWQLGRGVARVRWQAAVAVGAAVAGAWMSSLGTPLGAEVGAAALLSVVEPPAPSLAGLLALFLVTGATLVGSGYVLVSWLGLLAVSWLGWLTPVDLLDAVSAGHLTPGPLFATATFAGYRILGHAGALVATVGIFAPAFAYAALVEPLARWLARRRWRLVMRDAVAAASVGLIAAAALPFARFLGGADAALAAAGVALMAWGRVPSVTVFVGIALAGGLLAR